MRNFLATDVNPKTVECQILQNFFCRAWLMHERSISHDSSQNCVKRDTNGNRKTQRILMVSNVSLSRTEINKIYTKNNTHNIITAKKGRNNIKFLCNSIFAHIENSKGVNNERNLSLDCLNASIV